MVGAVFVISEKADRKLLNLFLLYVRDWEYGEDRTWDCFQVITTDSPLVKGSEGSAPPVKDFDNKWAGKSLRDTEQFMMNQDQGETGGPHCPNPYHYLVLDDQGIRDKTVIVTDREKDFTDEDELVWRDQYAKVKVPWDDAYIMWCNLDIANMDFEDFTDRDKGADGNGWHTCAPLTPHPQADVQALYDKTAAEVREKRTAAIADLEKSGDI